MRLASVRSNDEIEAALVIDQELVRISAIASHFQISLPTTVIDLIRSSDSFQALQRHSTRLSEVPQSIREPLTEAQFVAPFYEPPKIWGIGLNYREHANDLGAPLPTEPASFMKPRTTIIGPGDSIVLPQESSRVTTEAELGVILGRRCSNVNVNDVENVIFGYVPVLDTTAEDILQRNPRFLTRAKSFDTFFSFGPCILTPEEIRELDNTKVATVLNDRVEKSNLVRNMTFSPAYLVSFHSRIFTFEPGDILSTGTPGAVGIKHGDRVECRIDGFPSLHNNVV